MPSPVERQLRLRSRLPLALLLLLTGVQMVEPDRAWMFLWVGLVVWVGIGYVWALNMRDSVHVLRHTQGQWVVVGDRLQESFELWNHSPLPVLWATVRDDSDVPGYRIDRVVATDGSGRYKWRTRGICQTRGVFTLGPWSVEMGDPFGLFTVKLMYPQVRSLIVYPRVMQLPEFTLPQGKVSGRAQHRQATTQASVMVDRVRPYSPGDSLKHIHWRKSAQQQSLMVKQFAHEPAGDLWLLLDLNAAVHVGEGQESTMEYGIILAASLAAKYLAANRGVGLIAYGQETVLLPPQAGQWQLWRILEVLAHAASAPQWPLARVLHTVQADLGRGRTALVLTPSTAGQWLGELMQLRRQDVAVAALLLDASSFAAAALPGAVPPPGLDQVMAMRRQLADLNVPTHMIAKGYPFRPLITYKRKRTVYRTLSGTGRVIAVEIEEEV
ncbi:MAG: DUF58 domain-containing protein [Chloroflexi bacterium]|nr:DUF58 domain-containing protein [Chloroflexota bacterium]